MAAPNAGTPGQQQPMPKMTGMLIALMLMIVMMMFYEPIGRYMNYVMFVINFNYEHPVVTLITAGVFMVTLSTVIRAFTTDMVKQQRNQKEMSAFNAELRKARIENNLYKIKKLTEQQQKMMGKSMESTSSMMKTMPITMLIIIPVFAWVRFFITQLPEAMINVPWGSVDLNSSIWFLPAWILIYTLISIPFGQLIGRLLRVIEFRKRLKELDSEVAEVL